MMLSFPVFSMANNLVAPVEAFAREGNATFTIINHNLGETPFFN